ncbi:hypothetical protein [Alkalihalobacterium elongatum]|uniref:hypothetical protein n=1 Tax=Alkalihalobacterium elongatum TaxID=2675466 RepID=UPI001C1F6B4A|nr:hypothetical protein [Alkalihalobacterium elongatum]
MRIIRRLYGKVKKEKSSIIHKEESNLPSISIFQSPPKNYQYIKEAFSGTEDLRAKVVVIENQRGVIMYLAPLINNELFQNTLHRFMEYSNDEIKATNQEY